MPFKECVIAVFQPPPTWASPIIVEEGREPSFNPVWLKWFIDLVGLINESGGAIINHNDTGSLQGGQANQYYHLTAAQWVLMAMVFASSGVRPPTPGFAAQIVTKLLAGSGAPSNAEGANGDFYFRSDGTAGGNTVMYHKETGAWVAFVTA